MSTAPITMRKRVPDSVADKLYTEIVAHSIGTYEEICDYASTFEKKHGKDSVLMALFVIGINAMGWSLCSTGNRKAEIFFDLYRGLHEKYLRKFKGYELDIFLELTD